MNELWKENMRVVTTCLALSQSDKDTLHSLTKFFVSMLYVSVWVNGIIDWGWVSYYVAFNGLTEIWEICGCFGMYKKQHGPFFSLCHCHLNLCQPLRTLYSLPLHVVISFLLSFLLLYINNLIVFTWHDTHLHYVTDTNATTATMILFPPLI